MLIDACLVSPDTTIAIRAHDRLLPQGGNLPACKARFTNQASNRTLLNTRSSTSGIWATTAQNPCIYLSYRIKIRTNASKLHMLLFPSLDGTSNLEHNNHNAQRKQKPDVPWISRNLDQYVCLYAPAMEWNVEPEMSRAAEFCEAQVRAAPGKKCW